MRENERCECGGELAGGAPLDWGEAGFMRQCWSPGLPPEHAGFGWLRLFRRKKAAYPIAAYRCRQCGRLRLYAEEPGG